MDYLRNHSTVILSVLPTVLPFLCDGLVYGLRLWVTCLEIHCITAMQLGLCWSFIWVLFWLVSWPIAFILALVEVFLIPFCVCCEGAKTACENIDRVYKVLAFDPVDNARYMRPVCYNRGIPVPSTDATPAQYV